MKKASLSIDKLILIILAILVLLAILVFIFKTDILEWVRNLPQYNYTGDREINYTEVDQEILAGQCDKGGEVIATVGDPRPGIVGGDIDGKYLYYSTKREGTEGKIQYALTQLYWKKEGENSKINLERGGFFGLESDVVIAKVDNGIIKVEKAFLDLNSPIYQKTRFYSKPINEYILFPKLDNSYLGKGNVICKAGEDTKLVPAWPENTGTAVINIHPSFRMKDGKVAVDLEPYITLEGSKFEFLYVENLGNYLEIKGNIDWRLDWVELGRIYPDGSVWLDKDRLIKKGGAETSSEVYSIFNVNYPPYYESNIRVDNYENLYRVTQ